MFDSFISSLILSFLSCSVIYITHIYYSPGHVCLFHTIILFIYALLALVVLWSFTVGDSYSGSVSLPGSQ